MEKDDYGALIKFRDSFPEFVEIKLFNLKQSVFLSDKLFLEDMEHIECVLDSIPDGVPVAISFSYCPGISFVNHLSALAYHHIRLCLPGEFRPDSIYEYFSSGNTSFVQFISNKKIKKWKKELSLVNAALRPDDDVKLPPHPSSIAVDTDAIQELIYRLNNFLSPHKKHK